jgi:hypothetical protein
MSTVTRDRAAAPEKSSCASPRLDAYRRPDRGIVAAAIQLAILVACLAATVLIVMIALHTTPIADDYGDLAQLDHSSALQYLQGFWLNLTDRYADAVFLVALIKPFGLAAIHIATPLLFALLCGFCAVAARVASGPAQSRRRSAVVGVVAAVAIAMAAPSLFDTLGWFNAVAIYLTGVVAAAGTVAWMARLAARRQPVPIAQIATSLVIGFISAGFTEIIGMVITGGALLAVANARMACATGARRRALVRAYLAVATGAGAGVTVILLGPGSNARLQYQHGGFSLTRVFEAVSANMVWVSTFRWDALACVAAGLLLFRLRPALIARGTARWLLLWCVFLFCVPLLAVDVSTALAGGILAAQRTAYIAIVFVGAGVATFSYALAAALYEARPRSVAALGPAAAFALCLAVVGFGSAALPVISAEKLRQTALDARASSIRRQLASDPSSVWVTPTPLLIPDTSAEDFNFGHHAQYPWVVDGVRAYYGISAHTALRVRPSQPRSYCLNTITVPWAGAQSCEQLRAEQTWTDSAAGYRHR